MTASAIAIDCGTSTTAAAVLDGDRIKLGANIMGTTLIPSYLAYTPAKKELIGKPARARRMIDAENTLHGAKRIVGQPLDSRWVREFGKQYPFKLATDGDGRVGFESYVGLVTAEAVIGKLLAMAADLPDMRPYRDGGVVLTVPASFGPKQQEAFLFAAAQVGLPSAVIVEEPVAAAFGYLGPEQKPGLVAVYDFGGGTFDAALLEWNGRQSKVIATAGDPYLGGEEIDYGLAKVVKEEVLREHRWDIGSSVEAYERLVALCEGAKHQLCNLDGTWINLGLVDQPLAGKTAKVERSQMEKIALTLAQRSFIVCDELLAKAGVGTQDVKTLILAGGSARIPVISKAAETYFGISAEKGIEPELAVVKGAAVYGAENFQPIQSVAV